MIQNELNSIILEGNVCSRIHLFESTISDKSQILFEIENRRYEEVMDEMVCEVTRATVLAYGNVALGAREKLQTGSHVRIVGRLRQDENVLQIVAEHIELKLSAVAQVL